LPVIGMRNRMTIKTRSDEAMPGRTEVRERADGRADANEPDIGLYELASLLIKRKRFILYSVVIISVMMAAILLGTANTYRSTATILSADRTDKLGGLRGLAGLAGINVSQDNPSELFPVILRSRLVKDGVLGREYSIGGADAEPVTVTLQQYFGEDLPDRLYAALDGVTSIGMDRGTGVIRVSVDTKQAELSQAILTEYLAQLETFNLHKRRSSARENLQYLNRELATIGRLLSEAEDNLSVFQSANRDWAVTTNPDVLKELAQLRREVEIRTQAYLFLTGESEIAKLEAQKDVPIVRILDAPSVPAQKSGPFRAATLAASAVGTLFLAMFISVIHGMFLKRVRGPDRQAFQALREDLVDAFPLTRRVVTRAARRLSARAHRHADSA